MNNINELIDRFFQAFNDRVYLENKISFHLTKSSLETLRNVNTIIDTYLDNETSEKGKMLLNIYGMLQSLFVGVDALYGLSYGVTNRKWSVNVNNNPQLREVKFVRNDVVGHPTRRIYTDNTIGYCELDVEETTYYNLVYKIAKPSDNNDVLTNHMVDLKDTINSFRLEASKILEEIYKRMLLENTTSNEYFSEMVYMLFNEFKAHNKNYELLNDIKNKYMKKYGLSNDSNDRFLWRISHILELFNWDEEGHSSVVSYLTYYFIDKLYRMCNEIDELDFSNIILDYNVPKNVKDYSDFIRKNNILKIVLNDNTHPKFDETLDLLDELAGKNKILLKINKMFKDNKDNHNRIYLLGCMVNYEN